MLIHARCCTPLLAIPLCWLLLLLWKFLWHSQESDISLLISGPIRGRQLSPPRSWLDGWLCRQRFHGSSVRHLSDTRPECTLNNIPVVLCTLFEIINNNVGLCLHLFVDIKVLFTCIILHLVRCHLFYRLQYTHRKVLGYVEGAWLSAFLRKANGWWLFKDESDDWLSAVKRKLFGCGC
jgi:hypothetical protein